MGRQLLGNVSGDGLALFAVPSWFACCGLNSLHELQTTKNHGQRTLKAPQERTHSRGMSPRALVRGKVTQVSVTAEEEVCQLTQGETLSLQKLLGHVLVLDLSEGDTGMFTLC